MPSGSPAWSPRGDQIVFNGLKNGYSDLYLFCIETGELTRLTEDLYDDVESAWSPQGDRIAFASDRPPVAEEQTDTTFTYGEYDIYVLDLSTGNIQPVVNDDGKMDYLMNIIVGGTGAFEGATGMLLGITPGRGTEDPVDGISLPDSILKLMKGYVLIR